MVPREVDLARYCAQELYLVTEGYPDHYPRRGGVSYCKWQLRASAQDKKIRIKVVDYDVRNYRWVRRTDDQTLIGISLADKVCPVQWLSSYIKIDDFFQWLFILRVPTIS